MITVSVADVRDIWHSLLDDPDCPFYYSDIRKWVCDTHDGVSLLKHDERIYIVFRDEESKLSFFLRYA